MLASRQPALSSVEGRRSRKAALFVVLVAVAIASSPDHRARAQAPAMRWDGLIELISGRYPSPPPTLDPPTAADSASTMSRHGISADGRYILFNSDATNIGMGYPEQALYLRDRSTNETRVLLAGPALNGTLSADGNHVAYEICGQMWKPTPRPDGADICDVYTIDLRTWAWTLVSALPDGTFGDDESTRPVLSRTGRFVVFRTKSVNLSGGLAGIQHLVVRDRDADEDGVFDEPGTTVIEAVSVGGAGGTTPGDADSDTPEISDDGRFVAFRSLAANLVANDTNAAWDVFLRDRGMQQTRRLNLRGGLHESPSAVDSSQISMTPDGRYVAYASDDPLLAPAAYDDLNGVRDVFVYDRMTLVTTRVDVGYGPPIAAGIVPGNGPTEWPTLSEDGRYVVLQSASTNVEAPPQAAGMHTYVVDREMQRVVRVDLRPDGVEPNRAGVRPSISADGSLVTFVSQATNLSPQATTEVDRIYAAVHFELTPAEVLIPGSGGTGVFTVTAQQHTQWWMDWTNWASWWQLELTPFGIGSGEIRMRVMDPNPDPVRRSYTVTVHDRTALLTQLEGMSMTTLAPSSGPDSGGTRVTIRGTGFEPGARAFFDGYDVPTEFVDSTTIVATTPAHEPETVWVGVLSADYRQSASLDQAFRFMDTTPPEMYAFADGTQGGDGWFVGDVWVSFGWSDPQTPVTSTSGCDSVQVTADTPGTTFTCTATSEGGSASRSITVKRDTTGPTVAFSTPAPRQMYELGAAATTQLTCTDALSWVAGCGIETPQPAPLDTWTPGWRTTSATAVDVAGNLGWTEAEFAVGSGVCVPGVPDMMAWWRMEGNTRNTRSNTGTSAVRVGLTSDVYADALVGQGYQFEGTNGYLNTNYGYYLPGSRKFSMAAWVKPSANTYGTIIRKRDQFALARTTTGSVAWAFRKFNVPTMTYVDIGVKVPLNVWTHIVVVLDVAEVKTYLNGRLAHTATNIGDVYAWDLPDTITIGGGQEGNNYFKGVLDELQLYSRAMDAAAIEELFLSGSGGACPPLATQFHWSQPLQATWGSSTYPIDVTLRDETGQPVVGRTVHLLSIVGAQPYSTSTANRVTDANGTVHWDAPLKNAPPGLYRDFMSATFAGDLEYVRAYAEPDVMVNRATPVITWAQPPAITYGSAIGAAQLNATASVGGTFSYSPAAGTVLPAGTHQLSVTFTPANTTNYTTATATVSLTVNKRTPTVSVTGGTFTYDGQPHAATGTVTGLGGANLGVPSFTYDGSPNPPVDAGAYAVTGSFEGNANYNAASATATLTIAKTAAVVTATGGAFTYDGRPHPATGSVTGAGGVSLGTPTFTYNGAADVPVTAGSYAVVAAFAGDANHNPASANATLTIARASASLTWTAPAAIVYGTPLGAAQLNASSSVPGTFAYTPAAGTVLNAGAAQVLSAAFTPADAVNYGTGTVTTTIEVSKAPVTVTVTGGMFTYDGQPHAATGSVTGLGGANLGEPSLTYDGSPNPPSSAGSYAVTGSFAGNANYDAGSAAATLIIERAAAVVTVGGGTFTYDGQPHPATGSVTGAGGVSLGAPTFTYNGVSDAPVTAGSYAVVAAFAGDANHDAASASATLTIARASASLSWTAPAAIVYGTPLGAAQLNASSSAPGTFAYTPAGGTVLGVGAAHGLSAVFTPADTVNYNTGSVTTTIEVRKAAVTVSVTGGTFTYDGQPHAATGTATGAGGVTLSPVTFTYNGNSIVPVNAGSYEVVGTFAGDANHEPATGSATIAIGKASAVLGWAAPGAIVYGTPLGTAQLAASSNVAGSFAYAPAAGAVLPAGAGRPLTATFTPADPVNFSGGAVSTAITVVPAPLTVRAADFVKPFGAPLPSFTATIAGLVNGDTAASLAGTLTFASSAGPQSPVGSYPIAPAGVSSPNYTIAFINGTLSVVRGGVVVTLASSPSPSGLNQPMTFTAGVAAAAPAAGTPAGTVEFFDGGTLLGSSPLVGGLASLTTAGLPAGSHTIEARYQGDASFDAGIASRSHTVNGSSSTPALTLTSSRNPSSTGQTVTFTANVSMPSGAVTGSIQFWDGGTLLATSSISAGRATFSTTALGNGSHAITARYVGNAAAPPAISGVLVQSVGGSGWRNRGTTASLSSSNNPAALGAPVTLTATIVGSWSAVPTGRVLFMINGTVVGVPAGVAVTGVSGTTVRAMLTVPGLARGAHRVTVTYLGDINYKGSTASGTQTVN